MQKESLPEQVKKVYQTYFELPLGGKKVKAPYYMNLKHERAGLRVMVGKGSAEEIVHEVKVWAQLKGLDLYGMNEEQIREFMIKKGIGIDCSGFLVYALDEWFRVQGKGHLWKNLKYWNNSLISTFRRFLRPIENVGANLLTSELNAVKVENFDDIRPGDLIRAKGKVKNAHHVALVTDVYKNENGKVKRFDYVNSHRFYEDQNGARAGFVEITNPSKGLKDQKWEDNYKGRNYLLEDLLVDYEDNGIRRLRPLV